MDFISHMFFFCLSDNSHGFQVDNLRMRGNSSPFLNRHALVRKRFLGRPCGRHASWSPPVALRLECGAWEAC